MNIAIICGSMRENSRTRSILREVEHHLQENNINVDFVDLRTEKLPLFDGSEETKNQTRKFAERIAKANGLIIGAPEYHGSYPGGFKNAFDFLSSEQIKGKPVGLIASSGGGKGGINTLNAMRVLIRALYGLAIPDQAVVDGADFDSQLKYTNKANLERILTLADEVVRYAGLLKKEDQCA